MSEMNINEDNISKRWFCTLAVLIILVGIALRLPHFATRSLWFDEAVAANNTRGSLAETLRNTRTDNSCPILYPLILFAVQKVRSDPITVRLPALVSSVLLIILVVWMGRKIIPARAALVAALLMALALSQIRYAQEVREYAFASLTAGFMTYAYLDFLSCPSDRRKRLRLWGALALAPLIQYGLVLYGIAILLALGWFALSYRTIRWREIVVGFGVFVTTGLVSLFLTLRYQYQSSANPWYLEEYIFRFGQANPVKFLFKNTLSTLNFLGPGEIALGLVILGLSLVVVMAPRTGTIKISRLLLCAGGVTIMAALGHVYPFGGIRQCLYLAPLIIIAVAVGLEDMSSRLDGGKGYRYIAVITAILVVSGAKELISRGAYAEVEDSQTILTQLAEVATPMDEVYIYYSARPAVEFYMREEQHKHFIFGRSHRDHPDEYVREIQSAVNPNTTRLWLVFSHINFNEDLRIIKDMQATNFGWIVVERLRATNAALFEATRVSVPN